MVEVNRRVYLGLGSNVGDRLANLRAALCRLRALEGVNFLRASSVYETEPMGVLDQPRFLNLVAEVEVPVEMAPRALLAAVKCIEIEVGENSGSAGGPGRSTSTCCCSGRRPCGRRGWRCRTLACGAELLS